MNGWDIIQMAQVELLRCLLIVGLQKFSAIKDNMRGKNEYTTTIFNFK